MLSGAAGSTDCIACWGFGSHILDLCDDDFVADSRKDPCWGFGRSSDFPGRSFSRASARLEWTSGPLPLLEEMGDSSALYSMRERE